MRAATSTRDGVRRWREAVEFHRRLSGVLASVALLAAVTGAIELLKGHVPVLSLGVLYIFAVLPVAIVWGLAYAIPVSIASMATSIFSSCRRCTRSRSRTPATGSRSPSSW